MPVVTEYMRRRIVELHESGESQREISRLLNVSRHGVQGVLKRFSEGFGLKNKPKPSKRKLLCARDERKLLLKSKMNPKMTAKQLRQMCGFEHVSVDTIKRSLRRQGQRGYIACRKPFLTKRLKLQRLKWCKMRIDWQKADWKRVIFSDESKMELWPRRREYVRRQKKSSKFDEQYVTKTKKISPSLMVWGAIRADGCRVLLCCKRSVDQYHYQELLDEGLQQIYNSRYKFQHDGASCHTAHSTKLYLERKAIRMLNPWPAQSADLSPIENLWDMLKEKVHRRGANNIEELWKHCKEEWDSLPTETIEKLYDSMPTRIRAVVAARGGNTKY